MHSWVRVIFVFVQKEEKKWRTNNETLFTHISETAGAIYFNFGMQLSVIGGHFHWKFGVLQIKVHGSMMREDRNFVIPVNILTAVCVRPVFLGHTTHYYVSWSVTSNYVSQETTELTTNSESLWVQINLPGHRKLLVNSFYRPSSGGDNALEYFQTFCDSIYSACSNPNTIVWLGGDYNFPDIDWVNLTTQSSPSYGSLNDYLLDVLNDNGLSQMVTFPTRENSVLDLFITNSPSFIKK